MLISIEQAWGASPKAPDTATSHEIATRLATLLWNGPPDSSLLEDAHLNRLSDPGVLQSQIHRMLADDRANILPGEKSVLIIEDDRDFAQWLLDVARQNGFKGVATPRGKSALNLVREFSPAAITLDLSLPDMDGIEVVARLHTLSQGW